VQASVAHPSRTRLLTCDGSVSRRSTFVMSSWRPYSKLYPRKVCHRCWWARRRGREIMKQSNFLLDSGPIHFRHVLRCGELEPPSHAWLSPSAFGADTLDHPDRVCTRYPKTRRFLL